MPIVSRKSNRDGNLFRERSCKIDSDVDQMGFINWGNINNSWSFEGDSTSIFLNLMKYNFLKSLGKFILFFLFIVFLKKIT